MIITNIQKFSLHDGPGIRTTVFMKGCSLCCPWCSNPENLKSFIEYYIKDGKRGIYGKEYTVEEVFNEVIKDKPFYGDNGGVTFSGGEPLLQAQMLLPLLQMLKNENITTAVETSLFVPTKKLQMVIPFIDFFYVDIKIMNEEICKDIIKGNLDIYKTNLRFLSSKKKYIIRIPVIGGYTDDAENRRLVIKEIERHKDSIIRIELIKEHDLSNSKYKSLSLPVPNYSGIDDEFIVKYKKEIEAAVDIPIEFCKI